MEEIDKYIYPEWLKRIMYSNGYEWNLEDVFPDGTILKLVNLDTNIENEYTATSEAWWVPIISYGLQKELLWNVPTVQQGGNEGPLFDVEFIVSSDKRVFRITAVRMHDTTSYGVMLDINPTWIARLRLAFAMSQNGRLGVNSVLNNVPPDIINCIVENIPQRLQTGPTIEIDYQGERERLVKGGGKKKKIKSKKKRKTKRRKSKRKKHKTKRRK